MEIKWGDLRKVRVIFNQVSLYKFCQTQLPLFSPGSHMRVSSSAFRKRKMGIRVPFLHLWFSKCLQLKIIDILTPYSGRRHVLNSFTNVINTVSPWLACELHKAGQYFLVKCSIGCKTLIILSSWKIGRVF